MKIGELSRRTGIAASALRYYEEVGLITPVARAGGSRVYTDDILDRLAVISAAKDAGFTIAEIRQLINEFKGSKWRKLAQRKLGEIVQSQTKLALMKKILVALSDCGCFDLAECGRLLKSRRKRSEAAQ
jgi:DNA-binding transcriptional MerR regulator